MRHITNTTKTELSETGTQPQRDFSYNMKKQFPTVLISTCVIY